MAEYNPEGQVVTGACGHCGAWVTFDNKATMSHQYVVEHQQGKSQIEDAWFFLCCPGCKKGCLVFVVNVAARQPGPETIVVEQYPKPGIKAELPGDVPSDIEEEMREAELCLSAGAPRGAAALFRSTLEKHSPTTVTPRKH